MRSDKVKTRHEHDVGKEHAYRVYVDWHIGCAIMPLLDATEDRFNRREVIRGVGLITVNSTNGKLKVCDLDLPYE